MTAASPPPPSILEDIEKSGFNVTHVYGLTESYGPMQLYVNGRQNGRI